MSKRALQIVAVVAALALALAVVLRAPRARSDRPAFTRVGQNGMIYTISVSRANVDNDQYLIRIADQLSDEVVKAGGSGQISVMIWPDDVPVPREPPTTEFDASMKTQAAGIFINPARHIKHLIRFRNGDTIAERDFK